MNAAVDVMNKAMITQIMRCDELSLWRCEIIAMVKVTEQPGFYEQFFFGGWVGLRNATFNVAGTKQAAQLKCS